MAADLWRPVLAALDRASQAGRVIDIWLRDDDAVEPTAALDRLMATASQHAMPVLLAVIPAGATPDLASIISGHSLVVPTQHGFSHANHAGEGERACELGGDRPLPAMLDDLRHGRDRLATLFGTQIASILVPPWNRIEEAVIPWLPGLGFSALSTFGPPSPRRDLGVLNADLDIIDWRRGRVCRPHSWLVKALAELIVQRVTDPSPLGLLTHHLVHDEAAWTFLDVCLGVLRSHPAVRFAAADNLLQL